VTSELVHAKISQKKNQNIGKTTNTPAAVPQVAGTAR
jgi:hypothetical protein